MTKKDDINDKVDHEYMNKLKKMMMWDKTHEIDQLNEENLDIDGKIEYWVKNKEIVLFIKGRLDDTEKYSLVAWKILEMMGVHLKKSTKIVSVGENPE